MATANSLRRQISRQRSLKNASTTHLHVLPSPHEAPAPVSSTARANADPNNGSTPAVVIPSPRKQPQCSASSMSNTSHQRLCLLLVSVSILPSLYILYLSHHQVRMPSCSTTEANRLTTAFNLLSFPSAWNQLSFPASPPPTTLKIALFVKRWPHRTLVGGLERHALTLHLALARRGHEVHVFTTTNSTTDHRHIHLHRTPPSPAGLLNQPLAWAQFLLQNSTGRPFDVVHTESVGLFHGRARNISTLAVSWHGIAYETIHSDVVEELLRRPEEPRKSAIRDRISKVVDEVRFFHDYAHHVATSDHVGDVLRRVYMIPDDRVHVILNGVDEKVYRPAAADGERFLQEIGVPERDPATLVMGVAGRLVKDKGHPIMFEALRQLLEEEAGFRREVYVLVAGEGPWRARYMTLGPNLVVLGSLEQKQLARFYSSLDVFVNPTLRAQGLDHTFLEAMMAGVAVMGTRFASVTGTVVPSTEVGYTFLPTVASVKEALRGVWKEGKGPLKRKGAAARERALRLFTATKMASAYERLFLCMARRTLSTRYCTYPLPNDGGSR